MADTGRVLTDLNRLVAISPPAHSATNAARVAEGTENYRIGPDGLPIYG